MARNPGSEAEPASAVVRTGTGQGTGLTPGGTTGTGSVAPLKTGVTGTHAPAGATPPPALPPTPPPVSVGLHAPAPTPGPVTREFVTLGRYQLLSRLAVGGMAEVYLARQGEISGFKTLVVVKKVLPHLAVKPDFINMFLDEARIASMLDHPNVVRISEVGRAGDEYFLAMELVQGKPLASLLQHGEKAKMPLPHNLAALVVANAAAGLHYAHQLTDAAGSLLGLVHRDVSPQNIMISFEGSVKVIDFGIARALGRLGDTSSGSLKGKLGYMAPEQARGEPVDPRADIFSLGVVLWECLAARRLFLRENELATLRAVVYESIPGPSKYAKVDGTLETIVMCALDRDPNERFQTAEEMRVALERWIFASGGTSAHDLSRLMKSWFPSDHVQWQRAARLALDMQESDPPIEVAFPNLASGKSSHSRTGTSRPDDSGAPTPPPVELPELRPKSWRRVAIPLVLAAAVAGGLLVYRSLSPSKPTDVTVTEPKPAGGPVRPTVETLPAAAATHPATASEIAPKVENPAETTRPHEHEPGSSEEAAPRRRHSYSAEKRALLRERDEYPVPMGKRSNPYEDKNTTKKTKEFRPNPF
jgi:serine/threonine protein kinase